MMYRQGSPQPGVATIPFSQVEDGHLHRFEYKAKNGDRHYIGRIGLSSPDHEPILTDWRAEAARPFYEATEWRAT